VKGLKPILYQSTETAFDTNGIGALPDAEACTVTEGRNGMYEMEMRYPVRGLHYADIALRCLITAKPNPTDAPQPFRIYRITRPMGGMVTVYAQHISYDLSGIVAQPFRAQNAPAAMQALKENAVTACPFTFWTDKNTVATMSSAVPASIRSLLGGVRGSVLDVYGGEYAFDRYTVRLYAARGANRGVSIRYGKNLTSLEQDENCAAVYTGVYPYWTSSEGELVQLPEKIVNAPGTYDFVRILPLDLSSEWQEQPTAEQLRTRAARYIKDNAVGVPKVSLSLSFAQLEKSDEYRHLALLERVSLCDTVNVEFPALGVSATAKAIRTVYDVLRDRYNKIDLGDARTTLADTIAAQGQQIKDLPQSSMMQSAVAAVTASILGAKGGAVRFLDTNSDGVPDTIYVADNPDPAQAVKVWRWNYEGWGASANGYNGPFRLAATLNDGMVADFITAGTLNANLINVINLKAQNIISGILSSVDKTVNFNLNDAYIDLQGTGSAGGEVRPVHMRLSKAAMHVYSSFGGAEKEGVRIASSAENNGGNMRVYTDGNAAVEIAGRANGGRIAIGDKNGRIRAVMGVNDSTGRFYFYVYNASGTVIYQVYETDAGNIAVYQKTS